MNAVFIYLLVGIASVGNITDAFFGWAIDPKGKAGELVHVLGIFR